MDGAPITITDRINQALADYNLTGATATYWGEKLTLTEPLAEGKRTAERHDGEVSFAFTSPETAAATDTDTNWPVLAIGELQAKTARTSLGALITVGLVQLPEKISYFPNVLAKDAQGTTKRIHVYVCHDERELPDLIRAVANAGERGIRIHADNYAAVCEILAHPVQGRRGMKLATFFDGIQFASEDAATVKSCQRTPHSRSWSHCGCCH